MKIVATEHENSEIETIDWFIYSYKISERIYLNMKQFIDKPNENILPLKTTF